MPYEHLNGDCREVISQMYFAGNRITEIALAIGRHRSTVYRELNRNGIRTSKTVYSCRRASGLAKERRRLAKANAPRKLDDPGLLSLVKKCLRKCWSPEQISGWLREQAQIKFSVSHFAIYRWLERDKKSGGEYWKFLRQCSKKRRKKYGSSKRCLWSVDRRSIDLRPAVVEKRTRVGDWEGDLMVGLNQKSYFLTLVERKTGFLIARRISSRDSVNVRRAIVRAFRSVDSKHVKTLTLDNGTEFSDYFKIEEQLGIKVYFAKPYCSWQRGTNENTNGLLRQFAPKRTDFRTISHRALASEVQNINNRPRKRLNYQTPFDALRKH